MTKGKRNNHYTWARAFRDIVVASINKGQLPILGVLSVFLLILWRIPERDLSNIVLKIVDHLIAGELFSYILLAVTCSGWFVHSKAARTHYTNEINRVTQEKSRLQNELVKKRFKSSEK